MMPRLRSLTGLRMAGGLGAVGVLMIVLAACGSSNPVAGGTASGTQAPMVSGTASAGATGTGTSVQPSGATGRLSSTAVASGGQGVAPPEVPVGSQTPAARCASAKGFLPGSSITVCPAAAPVGGVVQVTIKGCAPADPAAGLPKMAAAGLYFLGPDSWLGTNGGGGATVPFWPRTGSTQASATFTIPVTYTGGNEKPGPYPTLRTKPGNGYVFTTEPAGECRVNFTVTDS